MSPSPETDVVPKADVDLLLTVLRARYLNLEPHESNAIVLALHGLEWLLGYDWPSLRDDLEAERSYWEQHSIL